MKSDFTISRNYIREVDYDKNIRHILNKKPLYNTVEYSILVYSTWEYCYKSSYINLCRNSKGKLYFKFTLREGYDGVTKFYRLDTTIDIYQKHIKLNDFNGTNLGIIQIIQFLYFCLRDIEFNDLSKEEKELFKETIEILTEELKDFTLNNYIEVII